MRNIQFFSLLNPPLSHALALLKMMFIVTAAQQCVPCVLCDCTYQTMAAISRCALIVEFPAISACAMDWNCIQATFISLSHERLLHSHARQGIHRWSHRSLYVSRYTIKYHNVYVITFIQLHLTLKCHPTYVTESRRRVPTKYHSAKYLIFSELMQCQCSRS